MLDWYMILITSVYRDALLKLRSIYMETFVAITDSLCGHVVTQ
jgi:hypothetical protein